MQSYEYPFTLETAWGKCEAICEIKVEDEDVDIPTTAIPNIQVIQQKEWLGRKKWREAERLSRSPDPNRVRELETDCIW